jgi:hypothetical protein
MILKKGMIINKSERIFNKIVNAPVIRNIAQTQFALKSAEIVHRLTFEKRYPRMAEAMERFNKYEDKKPKSQIKREMNICRKFWGCYPMHYYRYNLYRKDKNLSDEQLIDYVPEFFFYYLFLPFYNKREFRYLISDKNKIEHLFKDHAIPQVDTICKLIDNRIYTTDLVEIVYSIVKRTIDEKNYQKIFVKPRMGEGGHGIYVFNYNNGRYINKDNQEFNEEFLEKIGHSNDYIIQPGVEQVPEIAQIYPFSVNTFRIVTENRDGHVQSLYAILRFGRKGLQVDNSDQGGLFVTVDVESGELGRYATSMVGENFENHPDTNFYFHGHKILNWNEINKFTEDCAKKLTQFSYLAWDIAITKTGPIVIEVNYGFSLDGFQIIFGGLRKKLRINDPYFYWKNTGKRK